jgi:uncharacterized protein (TIGR02996 family)
MNELWQAILDDPQDPRTYLVYADWLQSQGDPRGELIAAQVALETAAGAERERLERRAEEILAAHERFLPGVDEQHATVTWRRGFFESVRFDNREDWMDSDFELWPTVRAVFAQSAAQLVREMRVGIVRWEHQDEDVPRLLRLVAELGFAGRLQELVLGDIDEDVDLAHHTLGDLSELGRSYGGLRALSVRGWQFQLGSLALPELRRLTVQTCGLSQANLASVLQQPRPQLEELELWFGSALYGATCGPDDLRPLLEEPGRFPKLRALGLMNAEFTSALCEALARSPLLRQLETLDLSMGTLDDAGAEVLLARAPAFAHLDWLDLDDNFLSEACVERLQATFGSAAQCGDQKEIEEDDPALRYVSVWE